MPTNIYKRGNVEIVVHRPELDETERRKREEVIRQALVLYGKEQMEREAHGNEVHR